MITNTNLMNGLSVKSPRWFGLRLLRFGLGCGLWAIIIFLPVIAVFTLSMKGCPWLAGYSFGSVGNFLKFLAFLFMMMTVIGMLPIAYWAGKGFLSWVAERL